MGTMEGGTEYFPQPSTAHPCDEQPLQRNLNRPHWDYARTQSQELPEIA